MISNDEQKSTEKHSPPQPVQHRSAQRELSHVTDVGGTKVTRVKSWNGSSWVQVSQTYAFDEYHDTYTPIMQLDSTGTPVVAWVDDEQLYVKR